jgi:chromosome segregation ATPase
VSERLVEVARELEARDERVGAELELVGRLHARAARVAERAAELAAFTERLPAERERLQTAVRDAETETAAKARARDEATEHVARAETEGDREAVAAARRAVVRTADAASVAAKELERLRDELHDLEARAAGLAREVPELAGEAGSVSAEMRAVPRLAETATDPQPTLDGLVDWGSRARAALLVARGALESERERLVREANELGAAALGDTAAATSVSLVRERVERAFS